MGWQVRDQVSVVHYSVMRGNFQLHELGQVFIREPRAPEIVDLNRHFYGLLKCQIDRIDAGHSCTQTVTCQHYFGYRVSFQQGQNMVVYFLVVEEVVSIESYVNKAFFASREWFHFKGEILNPVLGVSTASPRDDYHFRNRFVADVNSCESKIIVDVCYVYQFGIILAEFACPSFQAFFGAVREHSISQIYLGQLQIVSVGLGVNGLADHEAARQAKEQGNQCQDFQHIYCKIRNSSNFGYTTSLKQQISIFLILLDGFALLKFRLLFILILIWKKQ